MHELPRRLLEQQVQVVVVGCGGTGSAIAHGLPYLHQSMLAFGHPHGLHVTLVDGDVVSETNCVRQPFARSEVGMSKAVILATRLNLFWGLEWDAVHKYVGSGEADRYADLVIGCVDTRKARRAILRSYGPRSWRAAEYWLDFGNDAETGQYVLGQFPGMSDGGRRSKRGRKPSPPRLPHAADLWPEIVDAAAGEDDAPSCSAAEALTRQAPFVNQVLANHGLALLSKLFRYGRIEHHGGYVNLATGRVTPIAVPSTPPASTGPGPKVAKPRRRRPRAAAV